MKIKKLLFIIFLLSFTTLIISSANAQSEIRGVVYDGVTNQPISNVGVLVGSASGGWAGYNATSQSDGSFSILVPPGTYTLYFLPYPRNSYAMKWYELNPITINDSPYDIGDYQLEVGVNINGCVSPSIPNLNVSAGSINGQQWNGGWAGNDVTGSDGCYSFNLPHGMYTIGFQPSSLQNITPPFYIDGTYSESSPNHLTTNWNNENIIDISDQQLAQKQLQTVQFQPGSQIRGTITGPDGQPRVVYVHAPDSGTGQILYSSQSAYDGTYHLNVPPGSYKILFENYQINSSSPPMGNLAPEWYSSTDPKGYGNNINEGEVITVVADQSLENIDASLRVGGRIEGRVLDPDGIPLEGVIVRASLPPGQLPVGPVYEGKTDANGVYTVMSLGTDSYILQFDPSIVNPYYAPQYYWGKNNQDQADRIPMTAGELKSINAITLVQMGIVSGKVIGANNNPIANVTVWLVNSNNQYLYSAQTDGSGNFSIFAPSGSYKVQFNPPSQVDQYYLQGWYSNGGFVTVTAGQPTTLSSAQLQTGGIINGKVTDTSLPLGIGIGMVHVGAFDVNGNWVAGMPTNNDGTYSFTLPAGSYKLSFNPVQATGTYLSEWYDNKNTSAAADSVNVTAGQTITIYPQLETGGAISGYVTNSGGQKIANVFVSYCESNGYCYGGPNTDANGFYTLVAPAGSWKVQFSPQQGTGYSIGEWYNNKSSAANADSVSFQAGITQTGYDVILENGGAISGQVTYQGVGIANVNVNYCDANTNYCYPSSARTNANGDYTLVAPVGSWKVQFSPQQGPENYLREWYNNKSSSINADLVAVNPGGITTNINAQLETGGAISGRVTNSLGQGIANVYVSYCDANNYCFPPISTNSNGDYTLTTPPGSWRVQFNASNLGGYYLTEWYNDKITSNNGDLVTVVSGQTTTGIDARLETGGRISGTVTNSLGTAGIPNVNVQIFNDKYYFINGSRTDGQGNYSLTLAPGTYKVYFVPSEGNYWPEWYDHKTEFSISNWVTVSSGQLTAGINARLANYQTLTISGYVRVNGVGISDVAMYGLSGSPTTNANGFYSGTVTYASGSNWSGMIIPAKSGYIFRSSSDPTNSYRSYTGITTNQVDQNFTWTVDPTTTTPVYYDDFTDPENDGLDISKWKSWQIREIRDFKFFSKQVAVGSSAQNRLEFRNPDSINHIEADVAITELAGIYGPNANRTAQPSASIAGIFFNDGTTGSSLNSYVGEILAQIRIRPELSQLISEWSVVKFTNSAGTSWEVLGSGPLSNSLTQGQSYRLSLDWNPITKTFSFSDGSHSASFAAPGTTFNPAKVAWKALRTQVNIGDATHGVSDPALWGKVSANFDNVWVGSQLHDDFSSATAKLDLNKWATFEVSNEIKNGQLILKARNGNINKSLNSSLSLKNPEQINELQAKVAIDNFGNTSGVSPSARIGGTYFNDTGDPNSGSLRDVWAQVSLVAGTPGQAPYAQWLVLRFDDPLAATYTILWGGKFFLPEPAPPLTPVPINLGQAYNLYLKWDGAKFIFKVNDYITSYTPNIPIFQPNNPSRVLATVVTPPGSYIDFEGSIQASFDEVKVGLAQFTSGGTNISTELMDQTTGNTLATLTFSEITQAGMTSLTTSHQEPPLPSGFQPGNPPTFYDISTGASFSGLIDISVSYAGVQYADEGELRLLHFVNGSWEDCTVSVDMVNKIIYGRVSSLSPVLLGDGPNRPPVMNPIGNKQVKQGQSLEFTIMATDQGDGLTYSAGGLPEGANLDSKTGTFTWTPTFDQAGNYPVTFTVTDNDSQNPLSDSEEITITVNANRAPVFTKIDDKTVFEDQLLEFTITATDPDGNKLTYSAHNLPPGADFDPATQTFTWTPNFYQAGNYPNIEFTVMDDGTPMELATQLITITVGNVNRAPVFNPVGTQKVLENQSLRFTVSAVDYDGDFISYSSDPLPTGANFNSASKQFTWTPDNIQAGTYQIVFYAKDNYYPDPATGTITVMITVGDLTTITEMANTIISTVIGLHLTKAVENSYMANLKKVSPFIEGGKITPAIEQIDAFILKVQQDISSGKIGPIEGNNLINMANALIVKIQG